MESESTLEHGRWLALDLGSQSIGIAISDPLHLTARPLTTLKRKSVDEDCCKIAEIVKLHDVTKIVVGKPLHLDGSESEILKSFAPIIEKIKTLDSRLQVVWADERLSSKEAEVLMAELKVPVKQRRKKRDEIAAALILRWYMEETSGDR